MATNEPTEGSNPSPTAKISLVSVVRRTARVLVTRPAVWIAVVPALLLQAVQEAHTDAAGVPSSLTPVLAGLAVSPWTTGLAVLPVIAHASAGLQDHIGRVTRCYTSLFALGCFQYLLGSWWSVWPSTSSLALLMVAGMFVWVVLGARLAFAASIVLAEGAGWKGALRRSWDLTRGNVGRIFLLLTLLHLPVVPLLGTIPSAASSRYLFSLLIVPSLVLMGAAYIERVQKDAVGMRPS